MTLEEKLIITNRTGLGSKLPFSLFEATVLIDIAAVTSTFFGIPNPVIGSIAGLGIVATILESVSAWKYLHNNPKYKILFRQGLDECGKPLMEMSDEERQEEIISLVEKLNDVYTPCTISRKELALLVNDAVTSYIASITGEKVITSSNIKNFGILRLISPSAKSYSNLINGEVSVFKGSGVFEPHYLGHEFSHSKGYWEELEAQIISYYALMSSNEPILIQSALCERLRRDIAVLITNPNRKKEYIEQLKLRPELKRDFIAKKPNYYERSVGKATQQLYALLLKLGGQNFDDYSKGFTNFLFTLENKTA